MGLPPKNSIYKIVFCDPHLNELDTEYATSLAAAKERMQDLGFVCEQEFDEERNNAGMYRRAETVLFNEARARIVSLQAW